MSAPLGNHSGPADPFQGSFINDFMKECPAAKKIGGSLKPAEGILKPAEGLVETIKVKVGEPRLFGFLAKTEKQISTGKLISYISLLGKLGEQITKAINGLKSSVIDEKIANFEHDGELKGHVTTRLTELMNERNVVIKSVAIQSKLLAGYEKDELKKEYQVKLKEGEISQADKNFLKVEQRIQTIKDEINVRVQSLMNILCQGKDVKSGEEWFERIKNNPAEIAAINSMPKDKVESYSKTYPHLASLKNLASQAFGKTHGNLSGTQAIVSKAIERCRGENGIIDVSRLSSQEKDAFADDSVMFDYDKMKKDSIIYRDVMSVHKQIKGERRQSVIDSKLRKLQ